MTIQKPTYLSQGVNYLGFLVQQLGDLAGKTTLAHELIQNADDAKDDSGRLSATRITFDITDKALVVSNDAVFREIDFGRMRDVASGSKRGRVRGTYHWRVRRRIHLRLPDHGQAGDPLCRTNLDSEAGQSRRQKD